MVNLYLLRLSSLQLTPAIAGDPAAIVARLASRMPSQLRRNRLCDGARSDHGRLCGSGHGQSYGIARIYDIAGVMAPIGAVPRQDVDRLCAVGGDFERLNLVRGAGERMDSGAGAIGLDTGIGERMRVET